MAPSPGFDLGYHPGRGQNVQDAAGDARRRRVGAGPGCGRCRRRQDGPADLRRSRLIPAIITADQTIRSTIQSRSPSPVRFYTEYLDLSWFPSERQERQLTRLMKHKYAGLKVDLIMACGDAALRFALRDAVSPWETFNDRWPSAERGS